MNNVDDKIAKNILVNIFKRLGFDTVIKQYDSLYVKKFHPEFKCIVFVDHGHATFSHKNYSYFLQKHLGKSICVFNPAKSEYMYFKFPDTIEELMIENDLVSND